MIAPTMLGTAAIGLAVALAGPPRTTGIAHDAVAAATAPAPLPAPAPTGTASTAAGPLDSLTVSYEVAGVKVIHRPIATNDVVAVNLYLLGGTRQTTAALAGIEPFLLHASEYGTKRYPGEAARRALAHTGSWISISTSPDYTGIGFRGIKQEFDSTWAVFADRVMHPMLDSSAMEITRAQLLAAVKAERESPESHATWIADSLAHESHPYAIPALGSEASIRALTAANLREYAERQMVTSRMLLVVVGDVSRERVEQAVSATLGTLPRGDYRWTLPTAWTAKAPRVVTVPRKTQTNYIVGYFSGPQQSSPDYPAFRIATAYLGGILFDVIRSEGLSYSAGAGTLDYGATAGMIHVSTVRPDSVLKIINLAIDYIQMEPLPRSDLLRHSRSYVNSYYYQTESNASQASMLAMAQLYRGDFRAAAEYADVLKKVTGADVKRAAREFIKNIQYAYVGDSAKAPVKLMMKP